MTNNNLNKQITTNKQRKPITNIGDDTSVGAAILLFNSVSFVICVDARLFLILNSTKN